MLMTNELEQQAIIPDQIKTNNWNYFSVTFGELLPGDSIHPGFGRWY